jgi:3-phosphoshikimate 1-carboxyvinyltransferase
MDLQTHTSTGLHGDRSIPGDKSISHRALMIGALAEGVTRIRGLSSAADVKSTMACLKGLALQIDTSGSETIVYGKGPRGFKKPLTPLMQEIRERQCACCPEFFQGSDLIRPLLVIHR